MLGLSSCVRYEEPTLVSLPGEYIIDKITVTPIDGEELIDSIYLPGTTFLNPNEDIPLDSIDVGFKKWHFHLKLEMYLRNGFIKTR